MLTEDQKEEWQRGGFFIEKALFQPDLMHALNIELTEFVRGDPPEAHRDEDGELASYFVGPVLVALEKKGMASARHPKDHVSKIFSAHKEKGLTQDLMRNRDVLSRVEGLLGTPDLAIIQSQFIFKNPGAWGQPWHQDSFYFNFDPQPQIGVWIATSPARIENGCLYVIPGSHAGDIHRHHADDRQGSNYGYVEIKDFDFSAEIPVLLDPGDVLFFHSYLMHKSVDNVADESRTALVFHYGRTGTRNLNPKPNAVVDIQPVTPL